MQSTRMDIGGSIKQKKKEELGVRLHEPLLQLFQNLG